MSSVVRGEEPVLHANAAEYWVPAFAGMTSKERDGHAIVSSDHTLRRRHLSGGRRPCLCRADDALFQDDVPVKPVLAGGDEGIGHFRPFIESETLQRR